MLYKDSKYQSKVGSSFKKMKITPCLRIYLEAQIQVTISR